MSAILQSKRIRISATVVEIHRGSAGPSAMLDWQDPRGQAILVASAPWSGQAAVVLAAVEVGDSITVTGMAKETRRRAWLPGEFILMDVEQVGRATAAQPQKAKQ